MPRATRTALRTLDPETGDLLAPSRCCPMALSGSRAGRFAVWRERIGIPKAVVVEGVDHRAQSDDDASDLEFPK